MLDEHPAETVAGATAAPGAAGAAAAPRGAAGQQVGVLAGTATHPVELGDVQQGGKRRMPATEWARGLRAGAGQPAGGTPGPGDAGAAGLVLH